MKQKSSKCFLFLREFFRVCCGSLQLALQSLENSLFSLMGRTFMVESHLNVAEIRTLFLAFFYTLSFKGEAVIFREILPAPAVERRGNGILTVKSKFKLCTCMFAIFYYVLALIIFLGMFSAIGKFCCIFWVQIQPSIQSLSTFMKLLMLRGDLFWDRALKMKLSTF